MKRIIDFKKMDLFILTLLLTVSKQAFAYKYNILLYNHDTKKAVATNARCFTSPMPSIPKKSFTLGSSGHVYQLVTGDWDGNGTFTPGLYQVDGTHYFHLSNSLSGTSLLPPISFGDATGDYKAFTGNWIRKNPTGLGLVMYNRSDKQTIVFLKDTIITGTADRTINVGHEKEEIIPFSGDWNSYDWGDLNGQIGMGVITDDGRKVYLKKKSDGSVVDYIIIPKDFKVISAFQMFDDKDTFYVVRAEGQYLHLHPLSLWTLMINNTKKTIRKIDNKVTIKLSKLGLSAGHYTVAPIMAGGTSTTTVCP